MQRKKSAKKILASLFCAVLMVCMLPISALAHTTSGPVFDGTTSGSLTINKTDGAGSAITDPALEYTIYKVAEVQQSSSGGAVLMQYILDAGVALNSGAIVGDGVTVTVPSGVTADDFDAGSLPVGTAVSNTGGTGTLVFNSLPLGLYLVRETVTPAGVSVSNDFLVSIPMSKTVGGNSVWDYDPIATPKNTVVDGKVSKTVTDGGIALPGTTNDFTASLGDTVTYEISATLPSTFTITPYKTYTIKDTPATDLIIDFDGAGLAGSFDGIVVKVGSTTLVNGTDYSIAAGGTGFVVELITDAPVGTTPGTQSPHLTDGSVVTITYDMKISPSATATSFTNDIEVNYETQDESGTIDPGTDDPPPTIFTYNYALQKVDGDNANALLGGATFAIQNSSGDYLVWTNTDGWNIATGLSDPDLYTFTSDVATNAIVPFSGLAGGSYSIVEISAPAGYSLLTAPVVVTIDTISTADADVASGGAGYSIQVVNTLANTFILPGTGGMGIYIYTIGGVLLIAAAIALFVKKKKKCNIND